MTKYVCTCGASHTADKWDRTTSKHYDDAYNCESISNDDQREYCDFTCPTCGETSDGCYIAVVEE
jgi:acetone carboxylase gamma subunit